MSGLTDGWTLVAMVTEGQPLTLRGRNPWDHRWIRSSDPDLIVAHPSYPAQRHRMAVYDLDSVPSIRFAAGEFSASVWGFYVPERASDRSARRRPGSA